MGDGNHWPRTVKAGTGEISVNEMRTCTFEDKEQLRDWLRNDGYLLLRGLLEPTMVLNAFAEVQQFMINHGQTDATLGTNPGLLSQQQWIKSSSSLMELLEHPKLFELFKFLFESDNIVTIPFKWLRAVGTGLNTGVHNDNNYVGNISQQMLTAWIPFSRVSTDMGSMVIAPKSHTSSRWRKIQSAYNDGSGRLGNGTSSGWLTNDPNTLLPDILGRKTRNSSKSLDDLWVSGDFEPGDVVILHLHTIHMTATNVTDRWRISCDTRWLPVPDTL
jgi:hypothetical protein